MIRRTHAIQQLAVAVLSAGGVLLGTLVAMSPDAAVAAPKTASTKVATIPVAGMTCGGCAANITAVLDDLEGVTSSSVDVKKGQAVVRFDPKRLRLKAILDAIASVGYEPGEPVVRDA